VAALAIVGRKIRSKVIITANTAMRREGVFIALVTHRRIANNLLPPAIREE